MKTKTNRVPIIIIISVFMMLVSCGQKQDKVKKIMEDGVEVVLNHIEPYRIKGESGTVQLKKEFSIDTENEEMLEIGLTGIETFDVDSEGNIYLIQWASSEDYIFKFDPKGNLERLNGGPSYESAPKGRL
jgi:hypothetical protein